MKNFKTEEALLTVGEPPPKERSVLSKKGGHAPSKDDRVKHTYTPDTSPPKEKKKRKPIIFGEANLDEGIFRDVKDVIASLFSSFGQYGLGDFAKFVDPSLGREKTTYAREILKTPLTKAEKHAIQKDYITLAEIRKFRKLSSIYNIFSPGVKSSKLIPPDLLPGAFEQLLKIEQELYSPDGLDDKYQDAVEKAEDDLNLPLGSGRFDAERAGLGRFKYFGRYATRRRKRKELDLDLEKEIDKDLLDSEPTRELSKEEKEVLKKERLVNVLQSFISRDGILKQAEEFLVLLLDFMSRRYPSESKMHSDLNRRLTSIRGYYKYLVGINPETLDFTQLKSKMDSYLQRVRPAMSRMRDLQEKIGETYGNETDFPVDILNISFTWVNPETGVEVTGEEKII